MNYNTNEFIDINLNLLNEGKDIRPLGMQNASKTYLGNEMSLACSPKSSHNHCCCVKSPDFVPTSMIRNENEKKLEQNVATGTKSGDFTQQLRTLRGAASIKITIFYTNK